MPLKLTIEVPDELVDRLDALAALWNESREQFAQQSVEFCIREGTKVEFEDDELTDEEWAEIQEERREVERGQSRTYTLEEVRAEMDADAAAEREARVQDAAE